MLILGISLIVGAAVLFLYSCFRGGYEAGVSYLIGIITGALLGSGVVLLVISKLL